MTAAVTTFETPGPAALRISLSGGEVTVDAAEVRTVEVELVSLRDNDGTRQAIAEARVEMKARGTSHEIVVQVPRKSGFMVGRNAKVRILVRCPLGTDLELRSSSADLEATGTLGAVGVKTASGDVSIVDAGTLDVDSASGDIRVRDVEGTIDVRTASGDVSVRTGGGLLSAKLVSGDLSVGEAHAGLAVTTVSGDVRVEAVGGGGMRVQSVSGDVHLAVAPGERLYVDVSSVSGTMSSELGLDDAPPAEAAASVHELHVRTVSGDVRIARAAVVGV